MITQGSIWWTIETVIESQSYDLYNTICKPHQVKAHKKIHDQWYLSAFGEDGIPDDDSNATVIATDKDIDVTIFVEVVDAWKVFLASCAAPVGKLKAALEDVKDAVAELDREKEQWSGEIGKLLDEHVREAIKLLAVASGVLTTCAVCKQEIDPNICGCGAAREGHGSPVDAGHGFIPDGCNCFRSK